MSNPYDTPETAGTAGGWAITSSRSVEDAAQMVADYFLSEKYRLESGTSTDGYYGIGSNILRMLLGALIKRCRFHVTVQPGLSGTVVTVEKGMSGAMGGVIGYAQMKKELDRVRTGLRARFG
ncbi:MAG: hypothetical protein U0996_25350 [Planctomycetaceae bacterium]